VGVAANAVPAPPAISPMVSPAVTRAFVVEITATPFGGLIHDGRQKFGLKGSSKNGASRFSNQSISLF